MVQTYVNYIDNTTHQQLIIYISIALLERSKGEDIEVLLLLVGTYIRMRMNILEFVSNGICGYLYLMDIYS